MPPLELKYKILETSKIRIINGQYKTAKRGYFSAGANGFSRDCDYS